MTQRQIPISLREAEDELIQKYVTLKRTRVI